MSTSQVPRETTVYADEFDLVFAVPCSGKTSIAERSNQFIDADTLYKFPGNKFWEDMILWVKVETEWAKAIMTCLTSPERKGRTILCAPIDVLYEVLTTEDRYKNLRIGKYEPQMDDLKRNYNSRSLSEPERVSPDWHQIEVAVKRISSYKLSNVSVLSDNTCLQRRMIAKHLGIFLNSPGMLTRMMLGASVLTVDRVVLPKERKLCEIAAKESGFSDIVFVEGYVLLSTYIIELLTTKNTTCVVIQIDREKNPREFFELGAVSTMAVSSTSLDAVSLLSSSCPQHPLGCLRLAYTYKSDLILAIRQVRTLFCIVENVIREVVVIDDELRSRLIDELPGYLHDTQDESGIAPCASSVRLLKQIPKDRKISPLVLDLGIHELHKALEFIVQVIPWASIPWDYSRIVLRPLCETAKSGPEYLELFDSGKLSLAGHGVEPWKVRLAMLRKPIGTPITICWDEESPIVTERNDEMQLCDQCVTRFKNSGIDTARFCSMEKGESESA